MDTRQLQGIFIWQDYLDAISFIQQCEDPHGQNMARKHVEELWKLWYKFARKKGKSFCEKKFYNFYYVNWSIEEDRYGYIDIFVHWVNVVQKERLLSRKTVKGDNWPHKVIVETDESVCNFYIKN